MDASAVGAAAETVKDAGSAVSPGALACMVLHRVMGMVVAWRDALPMLPLDQLPVRPKARGSR